MNWCHHSAAHHSAVAMNTATSSSRVTESRIPARRSLAGWTDDARPLSLPRRAPARRRHDVGVRACPMGGRPPRARGDSGGVRPLGGSSADHRIDDGANSVDVRLLGIPAALLRRHLRRAGRTGARRARGGADAGRRTRRARSRPQAGPRRLRAADRDVPGRDDPPTPPSSTSRPCSLR